MLIRRDDLSCASESRRIIIAVRNRRVSIPPSISLSSGARALKPVVFRMRSQSRPRNQDLNGRMS